MVRAKDQDSPLILPLGPSPVDRYVIDVPQEIGPEELARYIGPDGVCRFNLAVEVTRYEPDDGARVLGRSEADCVSIRPDGMIVALCAHREPITHRVAPGEPGAGPWCRAR